MTRVRTFLRREAGLIGSIATTILFFTVFAEPVKHPVHPAVLILLSLWIVATILWASFSVLRHADVLAHELGEPLGTLVLTVSVTCIEVSIITAVMFTGEPNPEFARDTMFAVIMLVMNGLIGLALLLGGFLHHEQTCHLQGSQSYLGVLLPLSICILVLPNFTRSTPEGTYSSLQLTLVGVTGLLLYGIFLGIQTIRHRDFFSEPADPGSAVHEPPPAQQHSRPARIVLLLAYLIPIVLLAETLGHGMDYAITNLGAPAALGGVIVAAMVLAPEGLSALSAALNNRLQRSINLLLGSAVASIGVTIPAVVVITLVTGKPLILGLPAAESVLLALTLASAIITFFSGKTNILQGAIHLVLFVVFGILIFD